MRRLSAIAVGVAALLGLAIPGAAGWSSQPGVAVAAGVCEQWDVTGTWPTEAANDYHAVFTFSQSGTSLSGSATLPPHEAARARYTGTTGSVRGTITGDRLEVFVTWPPKDDGTVLTGKYTGGVVAGGSPGTGVISGGDAGGFAWSGGGPAKCVRETPTEVPPTPVVPDTASVGALRGNVLFRVNGGPWRPLSATTKLGKGAEVSTDVDAEAVLKFSDGSEMTLDEMTQVVVDDLLHSGSRQAVAVQLKMGEMAAKVNPKKAFQTDFKMTTPTGRFAPRGTVFSVFHDAVAKSSIVSVSEGTVEVDPARAGLPTTMVPAGKELEVTAKSISRLARPGKAGARGGVNRRRARDLVAKLLSRHRRRCALTIPESPTAVAVKTAPGGWLVAVRVAGRAKGKATFGVARRKAKPKNAVAKKITRGCR
jgi:hypothetical protein